MGIHLNIQSDRKLYRFRILECPLLYEKPLIYLVRQAASTGSRSKLTPDIELRPDASNWTWIMISRVIITIIRSRIASTKSGARGECNKDRRVTEIPLI